MCKYCFNNETDRFKNDNEFFLLLKEINKKIGNDTFSLVQENILVEDGNYIIDILGIKLFPQTLGSEYTLYKCLKCNSRWRLSIPETYWRGYFKRDPT